MTDCIFCKIAAGEIPSTKVYEDEKVFAFEDLNPQAPVHILFIPKEHISHVDDIDKNDSELLGSIFAAINKVAEEKKLDKGFRVVINNKEDGGQSVDHLHFHLLGGRSLQWPPG